jgi:hypothetical protein
MKWNPIPMREEVRENGTCYLTPHPNQPEKSGEYLCECIRIIYDKDDNAKAVHYFRIMKFEKDGNRWHDLDHPSGISHHILAWASDVEECGYTDYKFSAGSVVVDTSDY